MHVHPVHPPWVRPCPEPLLDPIAELQITSELLRFLSSNEEENNAFFVAEVFRCCVSYVCIWCKSALGLHYYTSQVFQSRNI
jgi:hypothetical protein